MNELFFRLTGIIIMKKYSAYILLFVLINGCAYHYVSEIPKDEIQFLFLPSQNSGCVKNAISSEEYSVISAVIDSLEPKQANTVVLRDSTRIISIDTPYFWFPDLKLDSISNVSIRLNFDLVNVAASPICLDSIRTVRKKYILTDSVLMYPFKKYKSFDAWMAFYDRYPGAFGVCSFSRVAFNASRNYALLYVARSCGDLCGSGEWILLSFHDTKWWIKERYLHWIS